MTWPQLAVAALIVAGLVMGVVEKARDDRFSSGHVATFAVLYAASCVAYAWLLSAGGFRW